MKMDYDFFIKNLVSKIILEVKINTVLE